MTDRKPPSRPQLRPSGRERDPQAEAGRTGRANGGAPEGRPIVDAPRRTRTGVQPGGPPPREPYRRNAEPGTRRRTPAPVPPPPAGGAGHGAPPPRVRPAAAEHQRKSGLIALAFVLLLAVGGGAWWFGSGMGSPAPTPTPAPTVVQIAAAATPTSTVKPTPLLIPTFTPLPTATATPDPRLVGKVVCLDAGHGGSDRGFARVASADAPEMEEARINLAFALVVADELKAQGMVVVLTRKTDDAVNRSGVDVNDDSKTIKDSKHDGALDELQARINICNLARAELLVSIHINGFDDPTVSGYETWYSSGRKFSADSKRFATLAYRALGERISAAGYNALGREVNDDATAHVEIGRDLFDRYVITGPAQPGKIAPSEMPGSIVETLFISNDADAAFLASNEGQAAIVSAYVDAIVQYFSGTAAENEALDS